MPPQRFLRSILFGVTAIAAFASPGSSQSKKRVANPSYWPTQAREVCVEIDGYDFDFERPRGGRGIIDGPLTHNGGYQLVKNAAGKLEIRVNFGTDRQQRSDMDIVLRIDGRNATVTGNVKGRGIGRVTTPVRFQNGRISLEFQVRHRSGKSKRHVIRWRIH